MLLYKNNRLQVPHGEFKYRCPRCGQIFVYKEYLMTHLKFSIHCVKSPPYEECNNSNVSLYFNISLILTEVAFFLSCVPFSTLFLFSIPDSVSTSGNILPHSRRHYPSSNSQFPHFRPCSTPAHSSAPSRTAGSPRTARPTDRGPLASDPGPTTLDSGCTASCRPA